jgi:hypothetical protein
MILALDELYPKTPRCIIVLFDLRDSQAVEELHRLRAVLQGDSDIEALSEDCFALLIHPGAARRVAA